MKPPVGTIVCPGCGGGAPETAKACPYCGAKVVVPSLPPAAIAFASAVASPSEPRTFCARCGRFHPSAIVACPRCPPASAEVRGGRCPRCQTELETTSLAGCSIEACTTCAGRWFDGDELGRTLDLTSHGKSRDEVYALRSRLPWRPSPLGRATQPCVRCRAPMTRRQIARRTGIVVDVCRAHGVWFDGGEWESFAEFVRAEGLEVLRHDLETIISPRASRGRIGPISRRTYFPGDDAVPHIGFF